MLPDILFVLGLIFALLSIPRFFQLRADQKNSARALFYLVVGAALIGGAVYLSPDTYSLQAIPEPFFRILAAILNA